MLNIRAAIPCLLLMILPAFAQAPPPIPPIPDTNRAVTYGISSSTAQVAVPFNVYGDCTDIQVQINGVNQPLPSSLWNCASQSGFALSTLPLPITDMVVNLTPALTSGTLTIIGAWHPRNLSVPTAPGINRREFEQSISTLIAGEREEFAALQGSGFVPLGVQFPGLSSSVLGTGYPGLLLPSTSATNSTWFIQQTPTTSAAEQSNALFLQRNTLAYSGGVSGTVPSPLLIQNYSGRNNTSWNSNIASTMNNQSLNSGNNQNTAGLFYALKQNSTGGGEVGATFGINSYGWDQQPTVNPAVLLIGAEIAAFTSAGGGTDTSANRVALAITGGVPNATDAGVHIGTAIQIGTVGGATIDRGQSFYAGTYGTLFATRGGTVAAATGIDWSSATFSTAAIKTPGFTVG